MNYRKPNPQDLAGIVQLYRKVAKIPGGLARLEHEIEESYVRDFLDKSISKGVGYIAEDNRQIVGEIHAYPSGLFCFSHVLSDLTIAVDPDCQGAGIGRNLFEKIMQDVQDDTKFTRVELIARESNEKAIKFYESLGFEREGEFRNRIKNVDGSLESDIPMAWMRQ